MAREAEADALCKENTALKQQLRSLQQDCGRSRGAFHAVSAELAEVKDAFRQVGTHLPACLAAYASPGSCLTAGSYQHLGENKQQDAQHAFHVVAHAGTQRLCSII